MFCTKCGKQLSDDMAFCPNCGNKIADNTPHQAAPAQAANDVPYQPKRANNATYQATPPKAVKKSSVAKTILIAIVVIIVILTAVLKLFQPIGPTDKLERLLPGTWIASFADGAGECRLHFNEDADAGSAMLLRFDENGDSIGYFEIIYRGKVTYTKENEGGRIISGVISMENVSNKDNPEHDYEVPYITIPYDFNTSTNELTLESDFLSEYFSNVDNVIFTEHADDAAYYSETGERYYDWNLFD